jgi:hypothetical protein
MNRLDTEPFCLLRLIEIHVFVGSDGDPTTVKGIGEAIAAQTIAWFPQPYTTFSPVANGQQCQLLRREIDNRGTFDLDKDGIALC